MFFAGMTGWYSRLRLDRPTTTRRSLLQGDRRQRRRAALAILHGEKIQGEKNLDSREIIDGAPSDLQPLVRVTTCGVSGQLATDACYNDVNGYKTITDYWSADSVPTAYCSMHKSVSVCTESGLLATDYCPSYSVETRGIVLIPRGHPLYDYIDAYGDNSSTSIWASSPHSRAQTTSPTTSARFTTPTPPRAAAPPIFKTS